MNEKYGDIIFLKTNEGYDLKTKFHYLFCIPLNKIFESKKSIYFKKTNWTLEELSDLVFKNLWTKIGNKKGNLKLKKIILNANSTKNYVFYKFYFCLIIKDNFEIEQVLSKYFKNHKTKCYMFKDNPFILLDYCVFERFFSQLRVVNLEYPYSNCKTWIGNEFYSKFKCSNNCLKKKQRSLKYYYDSNETGIVFKDHFNDLINDKYCANEQCNWSTCELLVLNILETTVKSKVIKAYPMISNLDFLYQLISLISLITGLTIFQQSRVLAQIPFLDYKKKIRKFIEKYLKKYERKIKIFALIFSLILTFVVFFQMIMIYKKQRDHPVEKETINFSIKIESFSLVVCGKIKRPTDPHYDADSYNLDFDYDDGDDPFTFEHKTLNFEQLENYTNNDLNRFLKDFYIKYGNRRQEVEWRVLPKVYFLFQFEFYRCFQIELSFKKQKMNSFIMISKLTIEFNEFDFKLFLLPERNVFDLEAFHYTTKTNIIKKRFLKLNSYEKGNCTDYRVSKNGCFSRKNCIDKCITETFSQVYKTLTTGVLIDKDHVSNLTIFFNNTFDTEIKKKCYEKFPLEECSKVVFYSGNQFIANEVGTYKSMVIDLSFDIITIIEETTSFWRLIFDLMNFQSIIYGQNIKRLFFVIYNLIRRKRIDTKYFKIFNYFIYLICSIGLFFHLVFIYQKIVNGDLVYNQYYEETNYFEIPELIFCFDTNESLIDENHKQTGSYLNSLSSDLNMNEIFEKIVYLNETNKFITLQSDFYKISSPEISFKTFFFLDRKCIRISLNVIYSQQHFYYLNDNGAVKIKMSKQFLNKVKQIYFISKIKNTMHFSKLVTFSFFDPLRLENSYMIRQKISKVCVNDKFNLIKNPMLLFNEENNINDVTKYIVNLKTKFLKNYQYETKHLPIGDDTFDLEIDDDLFEQFFSQIQNKTDNQFENNNFNYERHYITNLVDIFDYDPYFEETFEFVPIFFHEKLEITNIDNYTKLWLHIFNALSIWLDFNILDLKLEKFCFLIKFILNRLYHFLVFSKSLLCPFVK